MSVCGCELFGGKERVYERGRDGEFKGRREGVRKIIYCLNSRECLFPIIYSFT